MRMRSLCLAMLAVLSISALGQEAQDPSVSKIKAEKSMSGEGKAKDSEHVWVAVHDFSIGADLQQAGLNGWALAEQLETELGKGGRWKLVTRAKIAKALKEQKFGAEGSLEAAKMGKLVGADFIVTGGVERKGSSLTLTAKLIDVTKETGKIERSFSVVRDVGSGAFDLACLSGMLESVARKLVMTPAEFLAFGRQMQSEGDLVEARDAFMAAQALEPSAETKRLLAAAEAALQERRTAAEAAIAEASKLFLESKDTQNGELCARAAKSIETVLYAPRPFLSPEQRGRAETLLVQIREFRKGLYNGPTQGSPWTLPDLGVELVPVKAGKFRMGDPQGGEGSENPPHSVVISRPFWIGKAELSIGQYLCHLRDSSGRDEARDNEIAWDSESCPITKEYKMKDGKGETWGDLNMPIVNVSWKGADNFCKWLSKRERAAKRLAQGYEYRLPTEAEWEYACRAGSDALETPDAIAASAWNKETSGGVMHPAGQRKPNAWGLVDLCGNAWELCRDWYIEAPLALDATDPKGPASSEDDLKAMRGGSSKSVPTDATCLSRAGIPYKQGKGNVGFRIVCAPEL